MNMFKTALALGLAATAMAQATAPTDPCSVLTHNVGSCQLGQQLVDLNTMTTCKNYICSNLMSIYAIAHGADMTKKLQGQSYGCQIEDWDGTGVGDVICMPSSTPSPTPVPASCEPLVYSRHTCPTGTAPVDLNTLSTCSAFICNNRLGPWDYAHGSDMTKMLAGEGYGCKLQEWNGTGLNGLICGPDCTALRNATGACPAGTAAVGPGTLESCSQYICSTLMGPTDVAHGSDPSKMLTGAIGGCRVVDTTLPPAGYTICA